MNNGPQVVDTIIEDFDKVVFASLPKPYATTDLLCSPFSVSKRLRMLPCP